MLFTGARTQSGAYFGEGANKPIHLESVQCSGSEKELEECKRYSGGNSSLDHSLDVGVKCQPGMLYVNGLSQFIEQHCI